MFAVLRALSELRPSANSEQREMMLVAMGKAVELRWHETAAEEMARMRPWFETALMAARP